MKTLQESTTNLRNTLIDILGTDHVYIQPPSTISMQYPAIIISLTSDQNQMADNQKYLTKNRYQLTLIDKNPLSPFFDEIRALRYCSFDRMFKADNLNHFSFTIYF